MYTRKFRVLRPKGCDFAGKIDAGKAYSVRFNLQM